MIVRNIFIDIHNVKTQIKVHGSGECEPILDLNFRRKNGS